MSIVITVLHVVACFFLIVVVLLQTGKGADIGAVFGGSSQTIFGSSGAGNLLTRLTTWTAALFMFTSLFLTWSSTRHLSSSIVDAIPTEPPPITVPATGGDEAQQAPAAGAAGENAATGPEASAGRAGEAAAGGGAATDDAAKGNAANAAGAAGKPAPAGDAPAAAPKAGAAADGGAAGRSASAPEGAPAQP